jgi:uncharacterized protein YyaL (SSP411 family)
MPVMERSPMAAGQLLIALDMFLGPTPEIVFLGTSDATGAAIVQVRRSYLPNRVLACRDLASDAYRSPHLDPLFQGKSAGQSEPALFLCEDFACQAPAIGRQAIEQRLEELI